MPEDPTETIEVEWQFDAPDLAFVAEWLERGVHDGFTVRALSPSQLTDHYFDTDDARVYRAGFSARIRRRNRRCELTLKSRATASAGPLTRTEHTAPVRGADATHALNARGEPGDLLRAIVGACDLEQLFTIQTNRQRYELSDHAGAPLGEIDLDSTAIRNDGGPLALMQRVEIELVADRADDANAFVDRLVAYTSLTAARKSKLGTAMEAAGRSPFDPAASIGCSTEVRQDMTIGEAVRAAVGTQVVTMLDREPVTRAGIDPEALHDMRVAVRRARTLLHLFRDAAGIEAQTLERELRWVARVLGEVRDLDVQAAWLRGTTSTLSLEHAASLDGIIDEIIARRRAARGAMLDALDSPRYRVLQSLLVRYVRGAPEADDAAAAEAVSAAASQAIRQAARRVRRAGDAIGPESPDTELHALRKEIRRLRYLADFARPVFGTAFARWRPRLIELQDVLGTHQDAAVTADLLAEFATGQPARPPDTIFVLGMLAERNRVAAKTQRSAFPEAFGRLQGRRWRAARRELRTAPGS